MSIKKKDHIVQTSFNKPSRCPAGLQSEQLCKNIFKPKVVFNPLQYLVRLVSQVNNNTESFGLEAVLCKTLNKTTRQVSDNTSNLIKKVLSVSIS